MPQQVTGASIQDCSSQTLYAGFPFIGFGFCLLCGFVVCFFFSSGMADSHSRWFWYLESQIAFSTKLPEPTELQVLGQCIRYEENRRKVEGDGQKPAGNFPLCLRNYLLLPYPGGPTQFGNCFWPQLNYINTDFFPQGSPNYVHDTMK